MILGAVPVKDFTNALGMKGLTMLQFEIGFLGTCKIHKRPLPSHRELLSPQQHYDWGLRALKTVLSSCGALLAQEKQNFGKKCKHRPHFLLRSAKRCKHTCTKPTLKPQASLETMRTMGLGFRAMF